MSFLLITLLFCDLLTVAVTLLVKKNSTVWRDGMLLGVHIPQNGQEDPEVRALCGKTARLWRWTAAVNLPLGVLVCLPLRRNLAGGVLLWSVWLFGYIFWISRLERGAHRAMYQIKCRRGWFDKATRHVVLVDTVTAAQSGRAVPGWYWHLPLLAAAALPLPYMGALPAALHSTAWALFGCTAFTGVLLALLHHLAVSRANHIYTLDTARNLRANRRLKHAWGWGFLAAGAFNTAAWCALAFWAQAGHWPDAGAYALYVVAEMTGALVLLLLQWAARAQNRREFAREAPPAEADDDEYWQNGWYENPADPRVFVQKSAAQFSTNLGHPVGRALAVGLNITVAATMVFLLVFLLPFVNVQVTFTPDGAGGGKFAAAFYRTAFTAGEIQSVELADTWPEEGFVKTNGGASDEWLVGHFYGSRSGDCRLYLYPGVTPVLKIKLGTVTVYANSRDPAQTRAWAALLLQKTGVY